uniref:Uncharacterized protein n=1 Tax=Panagrellus redivivus TaxID=6233 RepID=A0A7E4W216_PANRE
MLFTFNFNLKRYFHNKYSLAGIILLHFIMYFVIASVILQGMTDNDSLRKTIVNETGMVLLPYFHESSLVYVGAERHNWTIHTCYNEESSCVNPKVE